MTDEQKQPLRQIIRLPPTSNGLQVDKFVGVTTPDIREKRQTFRGGNSYYRQANVGCVLDFGRFFSGNWSTTCAKYANGSGDSRDARRKKWLKEFLK